MLQGHKNFDDQRCQWWQQKKNMRGKQMSKHEQKRKISFCVFIPAFPPNILKQLKPHIQNESHNRLLGKTAFPQEMYYLGNEKRTRIYSILKQKNSHILDHANTTSRQIPSLQTTLQVLIYNSHGLKSHFAGAQVFQHQTNPERNSIFAI